MSVKFRVQTDRIDLAEELEEDFRKEAKDIIREAGTIYLDELKGLLARQPSGPARPGQPPARDTEELLKSLRRSTGRLGRDKVSYSIDITSHLHYEHFNSIEYGHINADGTRTLPRPFKRPTDDKTAPKIVRLFEVRL